MIPRFRSPRKKRASHGPSASLTYCGRRTGIIKTYSPDLIVHTDLNEHLCVPCALIALAVSFPREHADSYRHTPSSRVRRSKQLGAANRGGLQRRSAPLAHARDRSRVRPRFSSFPRRARLMRPFLSLDRHASLPPDAETIHYANPPNSPPNPQPRPFGAHATLCADRAPTRAREPTLRRDRRRRLVPRPERPERRQGVRAGRADAQCGRVREVGRELREFGWRRPLELRGPGPEDGEKNPSPIRICTP